MQVPDHSLYRVCFAKAAQADLHLLTCMLRQRWTYEHKLLPKIHARFDNV